jgi:PIN domain nuclease of toxin-antitoxin system
MKLLIDTHVFVWGAVQASLLSQRARDALSDPDAEVLLSAASAYEIEFKRDHDPLLQRMPTDLVGSLAGRGLVWLAITPGHADAAGKLARLHGDPFDRLIIAQAFAEGASVVSADRWFPAYGVRVVW